MSATPRAPEDDSTTACCEALERLGELRPNWINNPRYVRNTSWIFVPLIGALGIITGYALYFKIEPIVHGKESPLPVLVELLIAAGMVAFLEWVKEVIQHGAKHLIPSRSTLVISIFTLLLFEIFVLAAHSFAGLHAAEIMDAIRDVWQGDWHDFAMLATLWILIGAVLAGVISRAIFGHTTTDAGLSRRGAMHGAAAGLIAAAIVLAYVLLMRALSVIRFVLFEHPKFHVIISQSGSPFAISRFADRIWDARPFGTAVPLGPSVTILVVGLVVYWSWKSGSWTILIGLVAAIVAIAVLPVLDLNCAKLPLYVLMAWSLPGVLLGSVLPWLRPRARASLPRAFAAAAAALALIFFIAGITHSNWLLLLIPAVILAATAIEIVIGREIREYWPLAALSIAIVAASTTPLLLDQASFRGVLGTINGLTSQGPFSGTILGKTIYQPRENLPPRSSEEVDEDADIVLSNLCITGSIGFWIAVGLLLGWSIRDTHERTIICSDGKQRCFWVRERWDRSIDYHDLQHGIIPKSDHELFARLSCELLTDGSPWKDLSTYTKIFGDFVPEKVARMNAADVRMQARTAKSVGYSSLLYGGRVESVIENARRLQDFHKQGTKSTLLSVLVLRAKDNPAAAVSFLRSTFMLRRDFAVGSFLQANGFLPGAHFRGCWCYREIPPKSQLTA